MNERKKRTHLEQYIVFLIHVTVAHLYSYKMHIIVEPFTTKANLHKLLNEQQEQETGRSEKETKIIAIINENIGINICTMWRKKTLNTHATSIRQRIYTNTQNTNHRHLLKCVSFPQKKRKWNNLCTNGLFLGLGLNIFTCFQFKFNE